MPEDRGGTPLRPGGLASRLAELTGLVYRPAEREAVSVVKTEPVEALDPSLPLRVVTWNIQFCGSRRRKFFYDGGDAVHVDVVDRDRAVERIGAQLASMNADILLLQEIDRDSDRTGRLDELEALLARAPYPTWASATCHRSRFVPVPARHPMGRVDMHVAVLSRHRIRSAERIQLPLLRESRVRRALNLKRCILEVALPIRGRPAPLHVGVTHLSAFSRGDGTLVDQVERLREWMELRERAGEPFILGGDLNLLPPGDDPRRLGADAIEYLDSPNPLVRLIPHFRSVVPAERLLLPESATYLPWGAERPDRVLDYLFVSRDIDVIEAAPVVDPSPSSDHLALMATLRLDRAGTGAR